MMEQDFVKDPSKTITQLLNETISAIGEKIAIRRFVRYEMGEGLEKRNENFAEEIQKSINQHTAKDCTYDKLSPIGLNGNIRLHRATMQSSDIQIVQKKDELAIKLSEEATEIAKKYNIVAMAAWNVKSSLCSVCGKDYWHCAHRVFLDRDCKIEIKDAKHLGFFWSIGDKSKES